MINRTAQLKRPSYKQKTCIVKSNLILTITAFLFVTTFVTRLYFSGVFASKNEELREINDRKVELQKEIAVLKYEDYKLSSLSYVEEKAKVLGYITYSGSLLTLDLKSSQPFAANSLR